MCVCACVSSLQAVTISGPVVGGNQWPGTVVYLIHPRRTPYTVVFARILHKIHSHRRPRSHNRTHRAPPLVSRPLCCRDLRVYYYIRPISSADGIHTPREVLVHVCVSENNSALFVFFFFYIFATDIHPATTSARQRNPPAFIIMYIYLR